MERLSIDESVLRDIIIDGNARDYDTSISQSIYEEVQAYRIAEEQGLLLTLPCKVGDTMYVIAPKHYECDKTYSCEDYDSERYLCTWCEAHCPNGHKGIGVIPINVSNFKVWEDRIFVETRFSMVDIKKLYATREEAEKALAEMQKG